MIPSWVYARIAALLAAASAGEYVDGERVEGYITALWIASITSYDAYKVEVE